MRKTYLVTGGSSGIGLSVAKRLAAEGARLLLVSSNQSKLEAALRELPGEGHMAIAYDLSDVDHIASIFDRVQEAGHKLDGMVYCAGVSPLCLIRDNTPELMERVFRINVLSFIEMVKFFQREECSLEKSRIIAISSITARGGGYRQTLYGASKAALISAVKLMSKELLNRDIRVNCISPGVVESPLLQDLRTSSVGLDEKIKKNQPLGIIDPDAVAKVVAYLLTDGSDFLTGREWVLDGGYGN